MRCNFNRSVPEEREKMIIGIGDAEQPKQNLDPSDAVPIWVGAERGQSTDCSATGSPRQPPGSLAMLRTTWRESSQKGQLCLTLPRVVSSSLRLGTYVIDAPPASA